MLTGSSYRLLTQWKRQADEACEKNNGGELVDLSKGSLACREKEMSYFGSRTAKRMTPEGRLLLKQHLEMAENISQALGGRMAGELEPEHMTMLQLSQHLDQFLGSSAARLLEVNDQLDEFIQAYKYCMRKNGDLDELLQGLAKKIYNPFTEYQKYRGISEREAISEFSEHIKGHISLTLKPLQKSAPDVFGDATNDFLSHRILEQFDMLRHQPSDSVRHLTLDQQMERALDDLEDSDKHGGDLNKRLRQLAEQFKGSAVSENKKMVLTRLNKYEQRLTGIVDDQVKRGNGAFLSTANILEEPFREVRDRLVYHKEPSTQVELGGATAKTFHVDNSEEKSIILIDLQKEMAPNFQKLSGQKLIDYCDEKKQQVEKHLQRQGVTKQQALAESQEFMAWLQLALNQVGKERAESANTIYVNLLIPLTTVVDKVSPPSSARSTSVSTPPTTPIQSPPQFGTRSRPSSPYQTQLAQLGLIKSREEYDDLVQRLPEDFLEQPNAMEKCEVFRELQRFNSSLTCKDFGELMMYWGSHSDNWLKHFTNSRENRGTSFQKNMGVMRNTMSALCNIKWGEKKFGEWKAGVLGQLDMNALSAPYLLKQMKALSILAEKFPGEISADDMAYMVNTYKLAPLMVERIIKSENDPQKLGKLKSGLIGACGAEKTFDDQRAWKYRTEVAPLTSSRFNKVPGTVPAKGECFYNSVGNQLGVPARVVRNKCHNVAVDILKARKGEQIDNRDEGYVEAVKNAAGAPDMDVYWIDLENRVKNKYILTPALEVKVLGAQEDTYGELHDAMLVSLAFNVNVVPLMQDGRDSRYLDYRAYGGDGSMFVSPDGQPVAHSTYPNNLMLLFDPALRHWDPVYPAS
ncbi:hypothetical protein EOPP23_07145 [Endozoicomonas sp. OPT23]|uniref:hypothetical protein n=1 Tax=Endozoicomonas sp. OPT23 TaxID=2072845 RepID=UPI00129ACEE8|nr:hypothetical protein [Endozoicomonas sp. OPT23]MRI32762.1 hypothetical protein [Endozoicomonas sp. OPT23]